MQNRLVTIEYAGPSKRHPDKYATVKGGDGTWYDAPIGMLQHLQQSRGKTIEFVVEGTTKGDKTYWAIKGYAQRSAHAQTDPTPTVAAAPTRPIVRADDPTPERIYVCGIVNAAITSQQVNPMDPAALIAVTNAARQAWRATLGGNAAAPAQQHPAPQTQPNGAPIPPIDDIVPF
jgi:hypothetical protein